jgi:hypothetical protein
MAKLEAKRIAMIAAAVRTVAADVETKNGKDIFIMPRQEIGSCKIRLVVVHL